MIYDSALVYILNKLIFYLLNITYSEISHNISIKPHQILSKPHYISQSLSTIHSKNTNDPLKLIQKDKLF